MQKKLNKITPQRKKNKNNKNNNKKIEAIPQYIHLYIK